jgi:hypothetical protein
VLRAFSEKTGSLVREKLGKKHKVIDAIELFLESLSPPNETEVGGEVEQ